MIYLIGSLRNPEAPRMANKLRAEGLSVFSDWIASGEEADEKWQKYEQGRGLSYIEALYAPFATHVFQFDREWLDKATVGVLIYPAGKSAHLELGYLAGQGKKTYIVLDKEPERWDVMLRFATKVVGSYEELLNELKV
jgi:hypothetical protein